MPKKVCCCGSTCSTGYPTSCCKVPSKSCEGKDINITLDFYVKFYCKPNGGTLQWRCNDGTVTPLEFETEKWRLNFTYRISRFDTFPFFPKLGNDPLNAVKLNTIQNYGVEPANQNLTWYGGYGYLGGIVPGSFFDRPQGTQNIYAQCPNCTDQCDANNLIKGCVRGSYIDDETQERIDVCGVFDGQGGGFGNFGNLQILNCADCCYFGTNPWIPQKFNYTALNEEPYHACDLCNDGSVLSESLEGSFNYGVLPCIIQDDITGLTLKHTDFDLSLRDTSTWNFEFIPSYEGQESKLDISLLSLHWGCSTEAVPQNYSVEYPPTWNPLTYNYLFQSNTRPEPLRSWINNPYADVIGEPNPLLVGNVDIVESVYISPPTTVEGFAGIVLSCPCGIGQCTTSVFSQHCANDVVPQPRPRRIVNCNCDCETYGSCFSLFHLNPSPFDGPPANGIPPFSSGSRPHQIDVELGIGFRDTLPCGDQVNMDFWESLYRLDFLANTQTFVPRHVTTIDGKIVNNPEWYRGVVPNFEYAFYGQGMKMNLVYTRNSIPYEKYNHEWHDDSGSNCAPLSTIQSEPGVKNKPYQNYPPPEHPSFGRYGGVIYEGEYALTSVSGWYPVVRGYETNYLGFTGGSFNPFNAFSPVTPPVSTQAFDRCYPFRFPQQGQQGMGQTTFAVSNFPRIISDPPSSFSRYINRGTLAYNYSYGELTATVSAI